MVGIFKGKNSGDNKNLDYSKVKKSGSHQKEIKLRRKLAIMHTNFCG